MRTLPEVRPTPEQLPLIQNTRAGAFVIRGAAGSGKTTTALLRLRQLSATWLARRARESIGQPVRVLVITFNRTLRGYVNKLARQQVGDRATLSLTVSTFSNWAKDLTRPRRLLDDSEREARIAELCVNFPQTTKFLNEEVDYCLGRFPSSEIDRYLTVERTGRGASPRFDRQSRRRLLSEVVEPYVAWKASRETSDWNDLATSVASLTNPPRYDIIIADESQDLSANQIRGLLNVAGDPSSVTFVLDAAQRIYPRGFAWSEVGLTIRPSDVYRLENNYRNTHEICAFAIRSRSQFTAA